MLTTLLIVLPLAGALVVAVAAAPADGTAGLAFLVALVEVGVWIVALARFDFDGGGLQDSATRGVGGEPRDLVLGRLLQLHALARRRRGGRLGGGDRLRALGRPRPAARLLRAPALPHRRRGRDVRRAGPAPLLRLLRGDAHPAVRPRRRLGRRAPERRDADVRRLHDGRLAAHARVGRRLRRDPGHVLAARVRARATTSGSSSASRSRSRSRRRSSRCTAGCRSRIARRRSR